MLPEHIVKDIEGQGRGGQVAGLSEKVGPGPLFDADFFKDPRFAVPADEAPGVGAEKKPVAGGELAFTVDALLQFRLVADGF